MDGLPGDDPPARSAAARVPAARRRGRARDWPRPLGVDAAERQGHASSSCTRSTRCSATAAAAWASPIPEICEMQVARDHRGGAACVKKEGVDVQPEIMIPLVGTEKELDASGASSSARGRRRASPSRGVRGRVPGRHDDRDAARRADGRRDRRGRRVLQLRHQRPDADDVRLQPRRRRQVPAGLPRAKTEIWPATRSSRSTRTGVGQLVEMAVERGRTTRPDLKVGICGEHGGDPASVKFCHRSG